MNEQYSALRSNVSMLGKVLGETIKDALGEHILERVETIRKLSKSSRAGNDANRQELLTTLQNLSNDELLPVARAFSQFLNLYQHRRAIPQHFAERRSCQQPGSDRPHPA
ncbi:phosphoenolpyruvate carboxylase [Escherichia coli]